MQFVKFSLVGVMNTLISEGLYVILVFFGCHYLVASIVGFVISVLNAYYWNNRYVFKQSEEEQRVWWKTLLKTYAAYSGGQLLNMVLLVLWVDIVQIGNWFGWLSAWFQGVGIEQLDARTIGEIVAAGVNLVITVPLNYLINKYWTFGKKK